MTIYYVKQDNTIWGCGEADCCGEYEERIEESFVDCDHEIPESEMTGYHLQACNGGGDVLDWREAGSFEILAFRDGKSDGFQEGSDWGIEWVQKKQGENKTNFETYLEEQLKNPQVREAFEGDSK